MRNATAIAFAEAGLQTRRRPTVCSGSHKYGRVERAKKRIIIPVIHSKQPGTLRLTNAEIDDLIFSS